MKKKNGKTKFIAILLLILAIILFAFAYIKSAKNKEKKPVMDEIKTVDNIQTKEFDYVLYDNKSDLYKEYFSNLKDELMKDVVNDEEYAKIISKLFIVDFYSLKDRTTSTDVGGLDFIYDGMKENFILKATDTIYKYVESNVYGDRKQDLPKITAVNVNQITKTSLKYKDVQDENGYIAKVAIEYEKDMGFPKEITLSLVHVESKLYIVEVK